MQSLLISVLKIDPQSASASASEAASQLSSLSLSSSPLAAADRVVRRLLDLHAAAVTLAQAASAYHPHP
jgi:hypothetical protein